MYNTTDITFESKLPSLCLFVKINVVFNDWPIKKSLRDMEECLRLFGICVNGLVFFKFAESGSYKRVL